MRTDRAIDVLRVDRRLRPVQLVAVVAVAVLAAAVAAAVAGTRAPTYESRTTVLVDQPLAIAAAGDEGVIAKLVRLRTKYVGLTSTPRVLEPVAEALEMPVGELGAAISVDIPPNSLLLHVAGRAGERADAVRYSQAVAGRLAEFVGEEQEDAGIPDDQRFTFEVVAGPSGASKVSPTGARQLAVAATVGLLFLVVPLALLSLRATRDD